MSGDTLFIFVLVGVAAALMASNRIRFDIVALLVVIALILSGTLSVAEALAGFGNPVVILVAGLLVVGEMLDRTGVVGAMGDLILKKGGTNETRLLVFIMVGAAVLSAIMSSTAVVAIFIPIVLRIAAETKISASKFLMPMSYAALISGMLTLIATPPNLVVHEELKYAGYEGLGFFSFAPIGLAVLLLAVLFVLVVGRPLLPSHTQEPDGDRGGRSIFDLCEDFRIEGRPSLTEIDADSPWIGRTIADSKFDSHHGVRALGIMRRRKGGRPSENDATFARHRIPGW